MQIARQLDQKEEAKACFRHAIKINPQSGVDHFQLADLLEREQDLEGAKHHFAEALRLNPSDVESRQHLDRLTNRQ